MKLKHLRKIILSLLMIAIMILGVGSNIIYAADSSIKIAFEVKRRVPKFDASGNITSFDPTDWGFAYSGGTDKIIYQIVKVDDSNKYIATNFYCLNAEETSSWIKDTVGNVNAATYDESTDLKNKTEVANKFATGTRIKQGTNVNAKDVYDISKNEYYSSIIWLLDNFYIPSPDDTTNPGTSVKDQYLANAGIVYGEVDAGEGKKYSTYYYDESKNPNENSAFKEGVCLIYTYLQGNPNGKGGYYYTDSTGNKHDVKLTDDMIETVQQAVLWYFTNYINLSESERKTEYNGYTENVDGNTQREYNAFLKYLKADNTYEELSSYENEGECYQEQASILYNYLVDKALEAKKDGYTGETSTTTLKIKDGIRISDKNSTSYKIGPINIETTGTVKDLSIELKDESDNDITSQCTIPSDIAPNKDFYITVPASIAGNIKITASAKANVSTQTLWTNKTNVEQPLVEINRGEKPVSTSVTISNEKVFDLALRKIIKQVKDSSGNIVSIINEDEKDATRNITVDTSTIPNTATYKHRKDPVVVKTGYKVTYEIKIYNEGDIDGYASKVVDQLPKGVESTLTVGDTLTSSKGNVYEVESYNDNKLVLKMKSATTTSLKAHDLSLTNIGNDGIDTLTLECEVKQKQDKSKHYMTNIAYINEAKDSTGTEQIQDRKNTESKPSNYPNKTQDDLNGTTPQYTGGSSKNIYDGTNNEIYYEGQEDDDDFETVVLLPQEFDLKLIKYIAEINGVDTGKRNITVDSSKLNTKGTDGKKITTANYNVSKLPITVKTGDIVKYTFRIYNEADVDGYASEISENIPEGLEYLYSTLTTDAEIDADTTLSAEEKTAIKFNRNQLWAFDSSDTTGKTIKTTYLSKDTSTTNLIKAFDKSKINDPDSEGFTKGLSYKEVSVMFKVTSTDSTKVIRNEAAITEDTDEGGNSIDDRDSDTEKWKKEDSDENYDGDQNPKYKEDDEDYDNIKLARFDLSLRKFIAAISEDANIEEGEYLTDNGKIDGKYTRAPQVDTSKLKTGAEQTAIYNHPKDAVSVNKGDYVLYTIRVYNEGDQDGYASKITDYLPEYLNYIDGTVNKNNGWVYNSTDRSVTTDKLKYVSGSTTNELKAYDRVNDKLDYRDVQILCRVSDSATINTNITNIAEIAEYQDKNGNVVNPDADSTSNNIKLPTDRPGYEGDRSGKNASDKYYPGQEDDDDFEKVIVPEVNFDLALRKFITNISGEDVTTRIPEVKFADNKITYEHPKDVVKVVVGDTVTYTLRIFNEGKINGFAQTITDDIPEYLEYLPKNATNVAYRWKMYDKDGNETAEVKDAVKIVSDYTSKENGEKMMADSNGKITTNPNLLKAFDSSKEISETNPAYVDLKVAFKVKDPNSSKYIIKNKAQISEDADEKGNRIDDIDSVPDKWNEGEDDQDYENVSVQYFDLALLKYVSEVKVTEDGTTTTTKTGNKGDENDIMPKVEIHRKKMKTTKVKFIYTIKVTNEGDIPGYAKEITDYIPKGLEFYEEDNKGWTKKKDGVITTNLLSDKLLQPGKSATVKVTFRWKNNENNMGVKTNIAEISDDENEKGIPDRDSTPGNKKEGEDDIDDADVILSTKTGVTENVIKYVSGAAIILLVLAGGVVLIKKFVL